MLQAHVDSTATLTQQLFTSHSRAEIIFHIGEGVIFHFEIFFAEMDASLNWTFIYLFLGGGGVVGRW